MGEHPEAQGLNVPLRGRALAAAAAVVIAGCGVNDDAAAPTPETTDVTTTSSSVTTARPSSTATPATTTAGTSATSTITTTTSTTSTTSTTTSTTTTSTTTTSTTTSTTTVPPAAGDSAVSVTVATSGAPQTSCSSVTLIGDSTFVGYDDELIARLGEVGVAAIRLEIDGGRSVVETLAGQESGPEVAARVAATGFTGCWVVGLGTNDAANIAAGSNADAATRVQRMLDATAVGPIMWIDASTVATDGAWARPNMLAWNEQLRTLADSSDRITVVGWDAVAASQPWFVSDGIHPNAAGRTARAGFVADQLVATFPA